MHVSLINVLFYLKFDIRLNVDVISQHVSVYGLRLCHDRRLKASGLEEVGFFSWFLWDLSESNRTLTQATSVLGTLWISNCIAPNKPASLLPPKKLLSTTFTQWYAARLPKASLELCILDIKWSDRAIVWKACGYCVALFVKINFFYRFLWIILASFDRITQSTEREFDMNCIHPVLKQ